MARPNGKAIAVNALVLLMSGCSGMGREAPRTKPAEPPRTQVNKRQTTVQRLEERSNDLDVSATQESEGLTLRQTIALAGVTGRIDHLTLI